MNNQRPQKEGGRLFFLRRRWIGVGSMISGAAGTLYGLYVVIDYARTGVTRPVLFGDTPMAFATAVVTVVYGLAFFWSGWALREESINRIATDSLTPAQVFQLVLATLSSITLVIVALISVFK